MVHSPRRLSPQASSDALTDGTAAGSSSGAGASAAALSQRISKAATRAAAHIGSVVDDWPLYSSQPEDYIIGDTIGFGASSVVYQASFLPLNGRACAVKIIDLEAFGRDTEELRRETQLMSLSKHPNVLRVRGCWVSGSKLHIATRLMSAGSMLDIMRFSHAEGFEETVIATVLKQALEGLNYLHINGWLHRDLKAANMLVDDDGTVLLGDFGVGVYLGDGGAYEDQQGGAGAVKDVERDRGTWAEGKRKSFVGTPCWMAPEVVERKHYGNKADIWSFGITALELTQGRAPYSRLAPVKVLMKTLQEDPPTLDRTGNAHKYSKTFDDFIRSCLQKDPSKRPSAEKLLGHAFFKQAKGKKHLTTAILAGLPPLTERQERRRAMSIASLRNQYSWDFGSVSSRAPSLGPGGMTPGGERFDPFLNFSGTIAPLSPTGSMRSKIMSIDGSHAFIDDEDSPVDALAERWRNSMRLHNDSDDGSASPMRFNSAPRRHRNRSTDSNPASIGRAFAGSSAGPRHRKSVSFDDPAAAAADAAARADGSDPAPSDAALAPIAEMRSPPMGAAGAGEEVPPLTLDSQVDATPRVAQHVTPTGERTEADAALRASAPSPPGSRAARPPPLELASSNTAEMPAAEPEPAPAAPAASSTSGTSTPQSQRSTSEGSSSKAASSLAAGGKPAAPAPAAAQPGLLARTISRTMGTGGGEAAQKQSRLGKIFRRGEGKT